MQIETCSFVLRVLAATGGVWVLEHHSIFHCQLSHTLPLSTDLTLPLLDLRINHSSLKNENGQVLDVDHFEHVLITTLLYNHLLQLIPQALYNLPLLLLLLL